MAKAKEAPTGSTAEAANQVAESSPDVLQMNSDSPEVSATPAPDVLQMNSDSPEVSATPAPELIRWKISTKDGTRATDLVEAASIDDAIRIYNGSNLSYSRKQLTIEKA